MAESEVDAQCIAQCVLKVIPSLSQETVIDLLGKLKECGVSKVDDLRYVRESDISSVLRPIQVRRLLAEWTSSKGRCSSIEELSSVQITPTTASPDVQSISPSSNIPVTPRSSFDWAKFRFPLEKMPQPLINAMTSKTRPTPADRREMESSSVEEASVNLPATPTLIAFGTSALTAKLFMLAIDGVIVLHEIKDPITAIGLLFGSFFVFNLHYPASASITLEFIQRMFMQINPSRGTKTRTKGKKQHHINPKVLQLANALRDAESLWTVL